MVDFVREQDDKELAKQLKELTEKQLATYCPIMRGNCSEKCTFFLEGMLWPSHDGINKSAVLGPRCKLVLR